MPADHSSPGSDDRQVDDGSSSPPENATRGEPSQPSSSIENPSTTDQNEEPQRQLKPPSPSQNVPAIQQDAQPQSVSDTTITPSSQSTKIDSSQQSGSGPDQTIIPSTNPEASIERLSAFYSIPKDLLEEARSTPSFIESLSERASQFEILKSEKIMLQVTLEQEVHKCNGRVSKLKAQLESAQKETQDLRAKLSDSDKSRQQLQSKVASLESTESSLDLDRSKLQSRVETLVAEKQDTLQLLERRTVDNDDLRSQLDSLHEKNSQYRKQIVDLESKLQDCSTSQLNFRFKQQNLEQEIELLNKNNSWLDEELKSKTSNFTVFRKEKAAQISSLQSNLDVATTQVQTLEQTKHALEEQLTSVSKSRDDALVKIKNLQDERASKEESFRTEMSSQKRLAELWQQSANESKARIIELESLLKAEKQKDIDEVAKWRTRADEEQNRAAAAEAKIQVLQDQIDQFNNDTIQPPQLDQSQQQIQQPLSPAPGFGTPARTNLTGSSVPGTPVRTPGGSIGLFSPSAELITKMKRKGVTMTELYSNYIKVEQDLRRERSKSESLRQNFDELVTEVEKRESLVEYLRDENGRLESDLSELSEMLEERSNEKASADQQLKSLEIKLRDATREIDLNNDQISDLANQLQATLIELHAQTPGIGPLTPAEEDALKQLRLNSRGRGPKNDTAELITERLVRFKSVVEMQRQNQNLLKITRELGDRMEANESEAKHRLENLESAAVEEAKEAIKSLQSTISSLKAKNSALQRERDMFRRLLQTKKKGEDGEIQQQEQEDAVTSKPSQELVAQNEQLAKHLEEAETQYDAFKRETDVNLKTLNEQISKLSSERTTLQIQISTLHSQLELANERYKNLNSNLDYVKSENLEIKKQSQALQETVTKQDIRTAQAVEELVDVRGQADSLRTELSNLKAEKTLWKSIEERLTKDNDYLTEERTRLNKLVTNIQTMSEERERGDRETRERMVAQIESLESGNAGVRKRLEQSEQEFKQANERREFEVKQLQSRLDATMADLGTKREELLSAKANQERLTSRVDHLSIELKAAEDKLQAFQEAAAAAASSAESAENETLEQQLTRQVADLQQRLAESKSEHDQANTHIDELKTIAESAEEALRSLTSSSDEYKESMDKQIVDKDEEISRLKQQLEAGYEELKASNQELSTIRQTESEKQKNLQDEIKNLKAEIERLEASQHRLQELEETYKQDLKQQSEIAQTAQREYENELVKHAASSKQLQEVRAELHKIQQEVAEYKSQYRQAQDTLTASEESWATQKDMLTQEVEEARSRAADLENQNKLLHENLDGINQQMSKIRSSIRPSQGGEQTQSESETAEQPPTTVDENLQEIVRFLRREKEIADVQQELVVQENKRLTQQVRHLNATLDEVRIELAQETERSNDSSKLETEHNDLMTKINELNILRESNSSLRAESERNSKRVVELEKQLTDIQAELDPIKEKLLVATAESEAKDEQIRLVNEDNERWKNRAQQILRKYERVDPVELQNLKDEAEVLRKRTEELEKERDTVQQELQAELETARKQAQDVTESKTSVENELAFARDRFDRLRKESIEKLNTRRQEVRELNEKVNKLQAQVDSLTTQLSSSQEQVKKLNATIASSTGEEKDVKAELEAKLAEAQTELTSVRQQWTDARNDLNNSNAKLSELREQVEKSGQEQADKLKAINEQLTAVTAEKGRLESELKDRSKEVPVAAVENEGKSPTDGERADWATERAKLEQEVQSKDREIGELRSKLEEANKEIERLKSEQENVIKQRVDDAVAKVKQEATTSGGGASKEEIEKALEESKEQMRKEWNEEQSAEREKIITERVQAARKEFRAPTEQRMRQIIEKKVAQYREELDTNFNSKVEQTVKERVANTASTDTTGSEKQVQELETKLKTQQEDMDKQKKQAIESARKEQEMRVKLLQNRVEKLEAERNELKNQLSQLSVKFQTAFKANRPQTPPTGPAMSPGSKPIPTQPTAAPNQTESAPAGRQLGSIRGLGNVQPQQQQQQQQPNTIPQRPSRLPVAGRPQISRPQQQQQQQQTQAKTGIPVGLKRPRDSSATPPASTSEQDQSKRRREGDNK